MKKLFVCFALIILVVSSVAAQSGKKQKASEYYKQGLSEFNSQKFMEAKEAFDKAIKLNPKYAEAFCYRGLSNGNLQFHQKAMDDFDKAIELKPDFADCYHARGNAKAQNWNKPKEAIKDFDKAIQYQPKHERAYFDRGVAKYKLEDYRGAIQDFTKIIELNPKAAVAYQERGYVKSLINDGSCCDDWSIACSMGIAGSCQNLARFCRRN